MATNAEVKAALEDGSAHVVKTVSEKDMLRVDGINGKYILLDRLTQDSIVLTIMTPEKTFLSIMLTGEQLYRLYEHIEGLQT